MDSRWLLLLSVAASLLVPCVEGAVNALSVPPSTNWYGDDGPWSAVSIRVGDPQQWLDVFVSTVSSETWVVGPGGCGAGDSQCAFTRGGVFDPSKSTTWQNQGFFELGADKELGNTGYAQYGLDNLTFGGTGVTLPSAIVGAFNGTGPISGTSYLLGLFGLGVVPGGFNNTSPLSALSALVEQVGAIPSHSWGYTAGAKYQQKGVVNSLTLGGYDSNRFIPHNINFNLNAGKQLLTFVSSISVASSGSSNNWTKPVQLLSPTDQVTATIDSSTPYLWLPQAVCERFAQTLGLTYNTTLNLYTFDGNASQHDKLAASQLSFTFSIADISTTPSTVDITLPYAAFDLQLTYPAIPFTSYGEANSTKYYFPLRQATNAAQYTIGRAFLQEAYVITDYERNTFSVHQAVHTTDSVGNTSIVNIIRPDTSTFTGVPIKSGSKLSTGAIVGIAIGAVAAIALAGFAIIFVCRRKRQKTTDSDDEKPNQTQSQPRTLLDRLRGRHRPPPIHEASGSSSYPTEVGADATHERFELPAPLGPAELDSESSNGTSLDGTTEHGASTQDSQNLSAYERARRKMERQQAALAHARGAATDSYPVEKSAADISQVAHYRPPDTPSTDSPLVSPLGAESHGSLTISGQTSPVSPGFVSAPTSPTGPPPTYRRINPSNVVYAGRLPDNVQLPQIVPRLIGPDGRTVRTESSLASDPSGGNTNSSLGSQYTENESEDLYGSGNTNIVSPVASGSTGSGSGSGGHTDPVSSFGSGSEGTRGVEAERERGVLREDTVLSRNMSMLDPWGSRRRLDGEDLVHVPQPAENRFSWEEERISGTEEGRSL